MIKLGLTGGIGCGKSIIARYFSLFGIPVYNSDLEAKKLYRHDKYLKTEILKRFGGESYLSSGEINKQFMISKVFSNPDELEVLNQLVHPRVKLNFENWIEQNGNSPIIIKEAAILFESGAYRQMDKIIVVTSPDEIRIKRVIQRDKIDRTQVLERMKNQWPQEKLIKNADYIIDNSGQVSVISQAISIYNELKKN
jgi:dephospho-CoA kinase